MENIHDPQEAAEEMKDALQRPLSITLFAFALGIAFEILFFNHPLGISIFLIALLCILGMQFAARQEKANQTRDGWLLGGMILFFAGMCALRLEPMTVFLNLVLVMGVFALWVRTFRAGRLFHFGWLDFIVTWITVPVEAWIRPWPALGAAQQRILKNGAQRSTFFSIFRGLLIASPVILILLALLTSADLVFADRVGDALKWLNIERFMEYVGRTLIVLMSFIFFLGALATALRVQSKRSIPSELRGGIKPFLGFVESTIVLGSVNLLFAVFVAIQFIYLFGGQTNISETGFTYAEYARRGFFELVAVGIFTLGMILLLAVWSRRQLGRQTRWFNGLSAVMVLQDGVILYSALTRLLLYEEAYGFTRLRTYTHLFIPWMGVLLLVFILLLLRDRLRYFAAATMLGAVGFGITLNVVNVDSFIVRRNIDRYQSGMELDVPYLTSLSEDAVPSLIALLPQISESDRPQFLGELACWDVQLKKLETTLTWPSLHLSRLVARREFDPLRDEFAEYKVVQSEFGAWQYELDGERVTCGHQKLSGRFD